MYILFVLLCLWSFVRVPIFENVPLSVIQSDKGTSDDPFIPINREITDREILISITGLSVGYSWFIFPRKIHFTVNLEHRTFGIPNFCNTGILECQTFSNSVFPIFVFLKRDECWHEANV